MQEKYQPAHINFYLFSLPILLPLFFFLFHQFPLTCNSSADFPPFQTSLTFRLTRDKLTFEGQLFCLTLHCLFLKNYQIEQFPMNTSKVYVVCKHSYLFGHIQIQELSTEMVMN